MGIHADVHLRPSLHLQDPPRNFKTPSAQHLEEAPISTAAANSPSGDRPGAAAPAAGIAGRGAAAQPPPLPPPPPPTWESFGDAPALPQVAPEPSSPGLGLDRPSRGAGGFVPPAVEPNHEALTTPFPGEQAGGAPFGL